MAATKETGRDAVREPRELEAGSGRYDFKTIIGEGASAKVWHAFDTVAQRDVAIKEFESWEGSMSQFNREVRILEELAADRHRNMLRFHGWWEDGGFIYVAQQLCLGGELTDWLVAQPAYTEQLAAKVTYDIVAHTEPVSQGGAKTPRSTPRSRKNSKV